MESSLSRYLQHSISKLSLGGTLIAIVGLLAALDSLYKSHFENHSSMVWCYTVTVGVFCFLCLFNVCSYLHFVKQDEINRMSQVKSRLDGQILKRRQSSKKKRREK